MTDATPTLRLREWSRVDPEDPQRGALLRDRWLSPDDRRTLTVLAQRTSLRVTEQRHGLCLAVGPHVGTLTIAGLQIVIEPKLRFASLMNMVAYAFSLSDLVLTSSTGALTPGTLHFVDVLAAALAHTVERLVRKGLAPHYVSERALLNSPRGRFDMRHAALRPPHGPLRCDFDVLTLDHPLHQTLAAGLVFVARMVTHPPLALRLRRLATRDMPVTQTHHVSPAQVEALRRGLGRRLHHYRDALTLLEILCAGAQVGPSIDPQQRLPVGFLLDMNLLFERFLERYLRAHAPPGVEVISQLQRGDVFTYLENPGGWRQPAIRPDFVVRRNAIVQWIGDAKYRNRHDHPPTTAELYQLTTYGLAFEMPPPRRVVILHPLATGETDRPAEIRFAPGALRDTLHIHLVGVPLDQLALGHHWWPTLS